MKTKIILTVGCVGKTYVDSNYINIYDFDKHTLEYKYDKTGFEHLSNEEFKGLPNRTINDGWFEHYMTDWCKVIDSGEYEVVIGWLQKDCLEYLVNKGYPIEVVVVNVGDNESIYRERSQQRGNNDNYWTNLRDYYDKTLQLYKNRTDIKVTVFDQPYYLSEYLTFSGIILKKTDWWGVTYVHKVVDKVRNLVSDTFVPFYTQLILTALSLDVEITEEMVHDAWAMSTYNKDNIIAHSSMVTFDYLTKEVQNLDTPYVEKLNEVRVYFKGLRDLTNLSVNNRK